jgi:hypothetical protein
MAKHIVSDPVVHQNSFTADSALSAHEKQIFENFLKKKSSETAQTRVANDYDPDSLRYTFTIFH